MQGLVVAIAPDYKPSSPSVSVEGGRPKFKEGDPLTPNTVDL